METKPIPPYTRCNTVNIRSHEPYIFKEGVFHADETWWRTLNPIAKNNISDIVHTVVTERVSIPHDVTEEYRPNQLVKLAYIESFDYQHWGHINPCVKMVGIPVDMKKRLVSANVSGHVHPDLHEWIFSIPVPFEKCFVKLSGTSGKNEMKPLPILSSDDLENYLCGGNSILVQREFQVETKDTFIVFVPWADIDPRNEFRVFCRNNKIICASQQFTSRNFQYAQQEISNFLEAFSAMCLQKIPYYEFTLDVYYSSAFHGMHLIEINPYGGHSGCGSSLFEWERDIAIFEGRFTPEFRYVSNSMYI